MTYVMSDLHGKYRLYRKMLEKIAFGEGDTLYLLGDYVDRGEESVPLLQDMMKRPNVVALMGNHDQTMALLMRKEKLLVEQHGEEMVKNYYRAWFLDGGKPTYDALRALPKEERIEMLRYVSSMHYIKKITVNGQKYFLSHTLPEYDPEMVLEDCDSDLFLHEHPDYDKRYLPDAITITGHTPTDFIDPAYKGKIWKGNGHIAIDCGAFFTGTLGCLCIDTMEEFYVTD